MIKGIGYLALIAFIAFAVVVVTKDFSSGGMEASFSGQLLVDIGEFIARHAQRLWSNQES
jgi:hypothetical protein